MNLSMKISAFSISIRENKTLFIDVRCWCKQQSDDARIGE